jgi:peptidylprolyl isomerase
MKLVLSAAAISLALVLAGCSSGDDEQTPAETPVAEAPAEPAAAAPAEPAAAPAAGVVAEAPAPANAGLEDTLYIETACGRITIAMRPDLAPNHVARIKELARQNFYDGKIFHRVIDGFMAQTGDPTGTGYGASPLPDLRAEFSAEPFVRGTVGMARGQSVNSANSQFFIMFDRWASLDNQYTVWGNVTDGMDCVDQIARGEPPATPTVMISVRVAADVQ